MDKGSDRVEKSYILLISMDMKLNPKALKYVQTREKDIIVLPIIDPNLIQIISDIFVEKGWLGGNSAKELLQNLIKNQERMRKYFIKQVSDYFNKEGIAYEIKELNGNMRELILKEISSHPIDEIVFSFHKGFNPIWEASRMIIERLCAKTEIPCRVFR